jgi:trans-aconitate methyltransferase
MNFETWLEENDQLIDWNLFSLPWDSMQLKHNPFRQEQIEAILHSSGVLHKESPIVLDLGCGPGILGRHILNKRPKAQYFGIDGDF